LAESNNGSIFDQFPFRMNWTRATWHSVTIPFSRSTAFFFVVIEEAAKLNIYFHLKSRQPQLQFKPEEQLY